MKDTRKYDLQDIKIFTRIGYGLISGVRISLDSRIGYVETLDR